MRDIICEGGLTIRKGVNSVRRNLFVFSRPYFAEVSDGIEKLSSCSFVPSTEMKEGSGNSNMVRDKNNCKNLQNFLKNFSPFKETNSPDSIRNIVARVNGLSKLNVNTGRTVGSSILSDMLTKVVANTTSKAYKLSAWYS